MKLKNLLLLTLTTLAVQNTLAMHQRLVEVKAAAERAGQIAQSLPAGANTEAASQVEKKALSAHTKSTNSICQRVKTTDLPAHMSAPLLKLINEYLQDPWDYPPHEWLTQHITPRLGPNEVIKCAIQITDNIIAFGTRLNSIYLYDIQKKQPIATAQHDGDVLALVKLSDTIIVSGSNDKTIKVWDISDKKKPVCKATYEAWTVWHRNSLVKVSATSFALVGPRNIQLWHIENGTHTPSTENHTNSVGCAIKGFIKISDNLFASGGDDGTIKFWHIVDNDKGLPVFTVCGQLDETAAVTALQRISDTRIAAGLQTGETNIWDITDLKCPLVITTLPSPDSENPVAAQRRIQSISLITDTIIASVFWNRSAQLWDIADSTEPRLIDLDLGDKNSFLLNIADSMFASFCEGSTITFYEPDAEKLHKFFNT